MSKLTPLHAQFEKPFIGLLQTAFDEHADNPCLCFGDQIYTYRNVDHLSAQIANQLIIDGFETGQHGAVYSNNSAIAFIAALGIVRAGGVWIPINARNSASDNTQIMQALDCDALFFQQQFSETCTKNAISGAYTKTSICLDTQLSDWMADASTVAPEVELSGTNLITLPQTGGTTGVPKGVMISHRNFCALDHLMREFYQSNDVMLCVAPMTHAGGRQVLATMSLGLRFVILDKADPQAILSTVQTERVTVTFLPPTLIYSLLDQPNFNDFDLSSLRILGYGSSPMAPDRIREAIERIGPVLQGGFGQTECPMSISELKPSEHFVEGKIAEHRLRSVGQPTSICEVEILDDFAKPLPQGEHGEIGVKGPTVSEGYYKAPEETAKVRVNGWHLTGDIGYFDEDGYLYIVDRKKDMIITGGFNVYSAEVEATLMNIAGVNMAAVIGVPDLKWGERVTAYIETSDNAPTEQDIIARCKSEIGGVKAPKQVIVVENIPRTTVGKIDKKALRKI